MKKLTAGRTAMMKKLMAIIVFVLAAGHAAAQQLTVAVSPFDVRDGFTQDDADAVYELFVGELAVSGSVKVVDRTSFDKRLAEMQFQMSDWSDSDKVAQLGKSLNANSIIRGQLMSLGGKLIITANILDINTAQILSSSRLQLNSIDEVFDRIPAFVQDTVKGLPKPALKIGDKGPGGGIIFLVEEGMSMEVSVILGEYDWVSATIIARNHKGGGYSDWRLPSLEELHLIYQNLRKNNLGAMGNNWHWSSFEASSIVAWVLIFSGGAAGAQYKNNRYSVRAVRSF
jgi:TolB-like protein